MKRIVLPLLILFFSTTFISASTISNINLNVNVNICGNSVVESPAEDCEGTDLNTKTCLTQGYSGGSLTCDQACSFDTSACTSPSPTPTPSTSTSSSTSSNSSSNTSVVSTPTPEATTIPVIVKLSRIPRAIQQLLLNNFVPDLENFSTTYLRPVLQSWVTSWQVVSQTPNPSDQQPLASCDINEDAICNLTDLSVLLFYVKP